MQVKFNDPLENDTTHLDIVEPIEKIAETIVDRKEKIKNMLKKTTRIHLMLAKDYYMEQLGKNSKVIFAIDTSIDIEED